ncbi:MAG: Gfo/Idh/MocA family oxidoreductase [Spirochaetes bacterium]|nr:Gfo/Idh/MocA family oxidoreductase [Spirochaetota bacterium]
MKKSDKTRIGLIGAGNICRVGHGPAIKADGRAYIAAISDPDHRNRSLFAKKYHVQGVYEDHRTMLENEELDAVVISSPPSLHAVHVEDSARKGLPILCEKPMATNLKDCRTILEAGKKQNVYILMGHCKRFEPGHQRIRELLMNNSLGRIFQISIFWYFFIPDFTAGPLGKIVQKLKKYGFDLVRDFGFWRYSDVRAGGGDFFDHAPHYLDIIRFYGMEIEQVSCETKRCYPESRPYEDLAVATFKLSNGAVLLYDKNVIRTGSPYGFERGYIYGEKGKIAFRAAHAYKKRRLKVGVYRLLNILHNHYYPVIFPYSRKKTMFYRQMKYFIDNVRHENTMKDGISGPWGATPEDSFLTIAWTLASYKSAREGIKITRDNLFREIESFQTDRPHDW